MKNKYGFSEDITKEKFLLWVCSQAQARLSSDRESGKITNEQYWKYLDNILGQAEELFDVKLRLIMEG